MPRVIRGGQRPATRAQVQALGLQLNPQLGQPPQLARGRGPLRARVRAAQVPRPARAQRGNGRGRAGRQPARGRAPIQPVGQRPNGRVRAGRPRGGGRGRVARRGRGVVPARGAAGNAAGMDGLIDAHFMANMQQADEEEEGQQDDQEDEQLYQDGNPAQEFEIQDYGEQEQGDWDIENGNFLEANPGEDWRQQIVQRGRPRQRGMAARGLPRYPGDPRGAVSGGRGAKRMRMDQTVDVGDDQEHNYLSGKGPNKALQDMLGLREQNQGDVYDLYCDSFTIDDKIKQQVWLGRYVELNVFAPKALLEARTQTKYLPALDSHLTFQTAQPKKAANFNEWLQWFSIYASIFVEEFPGAASQLFHYQIRVFEIYRDETNTYTWRHYDEVFRQHKARAPSLAWEVCDSEFLRKARFQEAQAAALYKRLREAKNPSARGRGRGCGNVSTGGAAPVAPSAAAGAAPRTGLVCKFYNEGKPCPYPSCRFSHACFTCKGNHPQYQCTQAAGSAPGASAAVARK